MKLLFIALLLINSSLAQNYSYTDRLCGHDLSKLWLDIVFVVDNSKGMTNDGIVKVATDISSLFDQNMQFGSGYTDPRSTRVALVTYNSASSISFDLNSVNNIDDFMDNVFAMLNQVSQVEESYLATGLSAAEKIFAENRANNFRNNYKQMVILYASSFQGSGEKDPFPPAQRLREDGVAIATVAFDQSGENELGELGKIASPGMNLTNTGELVGQLQGLMLQVNCFCSDLWAQYSSRFGDESALKYGVCLQISTLVAGWLPAKMGCQNLHTSGHLATEFSREKHNFLFEMVQNTTNIEQPYTYHIGLNYVNGGWYWVQANGMPMIPLDESEAFWNQGYPVLTSTTVAVGNVQEGSDLRVGWQNYNKYSAPQYYICETPSCDTDNYCV